MRTKRMTLPEICQKDREFIVKQFSDDDVNEFLYDAEPITELSEADELIAFYMEPEPKNQYRFILTLSDGTKIGTCGFHCINREKKTAEMGYDLQKAYWGQGYMSEAIEAILLFAKQELKLQEIHAHIFPENKRSVVVVTRFGFEDSGETVNYTFHGKDYLHNVYRKRL